MKKLLVVVDYQNDFVTGSLGFAGAEKLEKKIAARIRKAKNNGEDIVFTKDIHDQDYLATEEGKNLPVEHCLKSSQGSEFFGEINELSKGCMVFEKDTFGSIKLGQHLLNKDYKEITIIGLVSYICVLANAVICKSAQPNAHIIVEKDLVGAGDERAQEIGFEAMKNIHIEIR